MHLIDTSRLDAEQAAATDFPWPATLLAVGLLVALIATQRHLTRKTNRLLNVGLLVATAAVVVGMLWSSVALVVQSALVSSGRTDGTHQVDVLVRGSEALAKTKDGRLARDVI